MRTAVATVIISTVDFLTLEKLIKFPINDGNFNVMESSFVNTAHLTYIPGQFKEIKFLLELSWYGEYLYMLFSISYLSQKVFMLCSQF
jgi:hypothetical protein